MIKAIIAWGIGFGGVNYLPTHGLAVGAAPTTVEADRPHLGLTGEMALSGTHAGLGGK